MCISTQEIVFVLTLKFFFANRNMKLHYFATSLILI